MNYLIPVIAILLAVWLAFSRRLKKSSSWQATITPLASIMGSGFLISAPLLGGLIGKWALAAMGLLLVLAFLVGSAIRFNIRHFEPIEHRKGAVQSVAFVSRIVLVFAYFISVVYYLELLAAFALHFFGEESQIEANVVTSLLLTCIAVIGVWRGLDSLEKVERFAVALNLGMIGSLLVALLVHNAGLSLGGEWTPPEVDSIIDGHDLRVLLGLLIVVQGFETSRYLGTKHPPEERISTMRRAQLISAAIYLVFVGLATVLFTPEMGADVTAILVLTKQVAIVLPFLLTIAALGSQFSAAVADTAGAGGLIRDISNNRIPERLAYGIIFVVTLALTWVVDVNSVIALASRAFALFYALQCLVAAMVAFTLPSKGRAFAFLVLAAICTVVFLFGIPAEG
ncbi:MAG: hypothetical protein P1U58_13505 [Verrucomicrobiales bacterium]|nr:hypothetical protein [Verrucomicrobiales bacterium]